MRKERKAVNCTSTPKREEEEEEDEEEEGTTGGGWKSSASKGKRPQFHKSVGNKMTDNDDNVTRPCVR